MNKKY